MQIQQNIPLRQYNTLGIDALAHSFAIFDSVDQLGDILNENPDMGKSPFILGGGSNILFTGNVSRLVLKNNISGIEKIKEDERHVYIRAGAGERWHQFVLYCLQYNLAGVENLSLIPGCVGASPMQNIGAYGVEIKDVFEELEAYHLHDKKVYTFSVNDCEFGYRESAFKGKYRDQFVILNVTYRLNKVPQYHIDYGDIKKELEQMGVQELSIQAVSQAVINIRQWKLPDPAKIGNAGSFFKNPSISAERFAKMKEQFPGIIGYPNANGSVKLAAGWLIQQAGWKGFRRGDAGVHEKQALVLVNHGHATGKEILDLSTEIAASIRQKFGVELEREVNIVK